MEDFSPNSKKYIHVLTRPSDKKIKNSIPQAKNKIIKSEISPFFDCTLKPTIANRIHCSICHNYFPLINVLKCCGNNICSKCALQIESTTCKCPLCKAKLEYYSNINPEQITKPQSSDKECPPCLPKEIQEVCKEFGYNETDVLDLLNSGENIEELLYLDP